MITSFSRLFRQIFGGSQAQPATEALSRDIGAESEAREAAEHRENLKRAMEVAFATPMATADAPQAPPIVALQAAAEAAAAAIATQAADPELDDRPQEAPIDEPPSVVQPLEVVAQVQEAAPAELTPAIELAEVEEPTEHDIEVVEWDVAKLVDEPAEPVAPPVEHRADTAIEDYLAVTAEVDDVAAPVAASAAEEIEEEIESAQPAASEAAEPEAEPELTAEFVAAATKPKRTKKAKAPAKKKTSTTKKKTAPKKTAALPENAVWLSDAIAFSLHGEWSSVWTPPEDASGAERLEAFREKAATGEIVIWGRPEDAEAWEPVKPAYWKTALVEPLSFLMGRENVVTDPNASKAKKPVKYTALKVARSQIEALWPPATGEIVRDAA
jgi:hypothetical protein